MLIRQVETSPGVRADVRIGAGRILAFAPQLERGAGEDEIDASRCCLIPGLHDHHMHLLALAAARASVQCGPPNVQSRDDLARALRHAVRGAPDVVRGINYSEPDGALVDRHWLDAVCPEVPVRLQHRAGTLWILNSAALQPLGPLHDGPEGIERDAAGAPTGRFFNLDDWLRERLLFARPSLDAVSAELARYGVTAVTDAGVGNDQSVLRLVQAAQRQGELRQKVLLMGVPDLPAYADPMLRTGPCKIYLREAALPDLEGVAEVVAGQHARDRAVAFHCTTLVELWFAIAVLRQAGCHAGDRIEHASVADDAAISALADLDVTVVTQPNFIHERGDRYRAEVEEADWPCLYRGAAFQAAGVRLAAGTDAPYGDPDPWKALRSARDRLTRSGIRLGGNERLSGDRLLGLFTGHGDDPARARTVREGAVADVCLLEGSLADIVFEPDHQRVRLTLRDGVPIWVRGSA